MWSDYYCTSLQGETPLHKAVRNGHFDMVELLLAWGADPFLVNTVSVCSAYRRFVAIAHSKFFRHQQDELTPKQTAEKLQHDAMVQLLSKSEMNQVVDVI